MNTQLMVILIYKINYLKHKNKIIIELYLELKKRKLMITLSMIQTDLNRLKKIINKLYKSTLKIDY